jgi:hypothetical protein
LMAVIQHPKGFSTFCLANDVVFDWKACFS